MRQDDFRRWLEEQQYKPSSIQTALSDAKRIETYYGDLDDGYDVDELRNMLAAFEYTKADERRNRPNPSKIPIEAPSPYSGLQSYKSAVVRFCAFRKAEESKRPSVLQWDRYLGAAKELIEDGTVDDEEGYKERIGNTMAGVRTALLGGEENWSTLLTAAVRDGGNNLIGWRDKAKIVDWIEQDLATVEGALAEMWSEDGEKSPVDRVRSFDSKLPEDVFTEGRRTARLDLASYLMMAMPEERLPPIKLTVFERSYSGLGYPASDANEDVAGGYGHALGFLDRVIAEADKRGMDRPRSRRDAQSVVWSLQDARWKSDYERDRVTEPSTLNTILYGPPGTGKTYRTVERCVAICDGDAPKNREEVRRRYEELAAEGRIEFVTFHQSYGYEEFVEGIRPVEEDGQVVYRVEPGILRELADEARNVWNSTAPVASEATGVELLTGDAALPHIDSSGRNIKYALEGAYDPQPKPDSIIDHIYRTLREFDQPMTGDDMVASVRGFTRPRTGEVMDDGAIAYTLRWLVGKGRLHVVANRVGTQLTVVGTESNATGAKPPNFVLVIDEINRANISKVMGELITLLEEDKREGSENEVTVTLPYSREPFTLPANLHILGTMNTADRSIALLDTALRRRFDFEEMAPDPGLLEDASERTGVDLPRVLTTMNKRLEYLVDRDHLIGHAWLMRAKDRPGLDNIMRRKVIPLIAEYFYDDWQKVRAILGGTDDFVDRTALEAPPGMDADMVEGRYRWSVRREFAEDAYEGLLGGPGGFRGNG